MIFGIDNPAISNRTALIEADLSSKLTYGELADKVNSYGHSLPARKCLLFLFCRNAVDAIAWYLASLDAGHAIALLDANLAKELREPLLQAYSPDIVKMAGEPAEIHQVSGGNLHPDLALLLSTSGTTGSAKFVRLTRKNVEANASSIAAALAITPPDRAITSLPMSYSYGLSVINTHLLAGASLVLTNEGLMSAGFWNAFREHECTSLAGVPYSYQIFKRLRLETLRIPSLRVMTQAGGKLHNDMVTEFHSLMSSRGGRFFVMYGQTEATARISILPHDALPEKLGSAGRAIPDGLLRTEPSGELVYAGPNVMMGYATNRADLGKGDELDGTLHTGDLAELDADGFVYITGRAKRDAKLFGLRLNLDDIENMMRPYGPTAVVAKSDKLVLFCEHGDEQRFPLYQRELAGKLKINHAAFEFRRIEQLPLSASGKIDYGKLAASA